MKIKTVHRSRLITPENLLRYLRTRWIGAWSAYGLAGSALRHYFPDKYDDERDIEPSVQEEITMAAELGCQDWAELIEKYHREVGYKPEGGFFHPEAVNRF